MIIFKKLFNLFCFFLGETATLTKWIALIALGAVLSIFAVQCNTVNYETRDEKMCGGTCHCIDDFDPICVDEKHVHFNGCYAGCTDYDEKTGMYANCTACAR